MPRGSGALNATAWKYSCIRQHQRNSKLAGGPQRADDELFGMAAVSRIPERRHRHRLDRSGIRRNFHSDFDHVQSLRRLWADHSAETIVA